MVGLQPRDAIVLYSDGLLAQLDGARVNEEILTGAPRAGARELIAYVNAVLWRLDAPLRDDVAVVALSRPANG